MDKIHDIFCDDGLKLSHLGQNITWWLGNRVHTCRNREGNKQQLNCSSWWLMQDNEYKSTKLVLNHPAGSDEQESN
jgi:hypothetical protein